MDPKKQLIVFDLDETLIYSDTKLKQWDFKIDQYEIKERPGAR